MLNLRHYMLKVLFIQRFPEILRDEYTRNFVADIIPEHIALGKLTEDQARWIDSLYARAIEYSKYRFQFGDTVEINNDHTITDTADNQEYEVVFCDGPKTWIRDASGLGLGEMIVPTETLRLVNRNGRPVFQQRPRDKKATDGN